jgi:hypothetical protein
MALSDIILGGDEIAVELGAWGLVQAVSIPPGIKKSESYCEKILLISQSFVR